MFHYFLEVSIAWFVFYSIYYLFLRNETFFSSNRWYLIHTLWIGILIPLVRKIPLSAASHPAVNLEAFDYINNTTLAISTAVVSSPKQSGVDLFAILTAVYFIGLFVGFTRMFVGLKRIYNIWKKGTKIKCQDFTLVKSNVEHLPFSFLKFVFVNEHFFQRSSFKDILNHEILHIRAKHTYDVLALHTLVNVFWWNPIIYFYKKSIKETHEYMADAYALSASDKKNYGQILLGHSSSGIELALTHQFFNSHLKKRINMMYKEQSALYKWGKYLLVLPMIFCMAILFSSNRNLEEGDPPQELIEQLEQLTEPEYFKSLFCVIDETRNEKNEIKELCERFKNGETILQQHGKLIESFPEHKYFITSQIEKAGLEIGKVISITPNVYGKYCMSTSPVSSDPKLTVDSENLIINFNKGSELKYSSDSQSYDAEKKIMLLKDNVTLQYDSSRIEADLLEIDFNLHTIAISGNAKISTLENVDSDKLLWDKLDKASFKTHGLLQQFPGAVTASKIKPSSNSQAAPNPPNPLLYLDELNPDLVPLLFVNGEKAELPYRHYYDPTIKHDLTVMDQQKASVKYGEAAKNGVWLISYSEADINRIKSDREIKLEQDEKLFKVVEEMPRFPGCEDQKGTTNELEECAKMKMLHYLYANLKYPKKAKDADIEGMVVVQFVIEKDGKMSSIKSVRDIGGGCSEEAKRVMHKMAQEKIWKPGIQRGKAVRVLYTLPVKFKLESEKVIDEMGAMDKQIKNGPFIKHIHKSSFDRDIVFYNTRKVDKLDFAKEPKTQIGFKLCINRNGVINYAELLDSKTNIDMPKEMRKSLLKEIFQYKFKADENAPYEECNELLIYFGEFTKMKVSEDKQVNYREADINNEEMKPNLRIIGNPVSNRLKYTYESRVPFDAKAMITQVDGSIVSIINSKDLDFKMGVNNFEMDVSSFAPGMYNLTVVQEAIVTTASFVVQ